MKKIKNIIEMLPIRQGDISREILDLPTMYKQFLNTYSVHINCIRNDKIFHEDQGVSSFTGIFKYIEMDDIGIYDFFSIEESNSCLINAFDGGSEILSMGYRPIAMCDGNTFLLVGTNLENSDQIFIEDSCLFNDGERIKFIAPNIFELLKYIWLVESEMMLIGAVNSYSQLYKNWGEDFWRIRQH